MNKDYHLWWKQQERDIDYYMERYQLTMFRLTNE